MASLSEVQGELQTEMASGGNKSTLMEKYSIRMGELIRENGGSISDIPMNPDHEYHHLQAKLLILNKL